MTSNQSEIINFPSIGALETGYLCVSEFLNLPFIPMRIFWTFHTPADIIRGGHAHYETEMIIIAVSGSITVQTENSQGEINTYILDDPKKGLYLPKMYWHTMKYTHNAVQLVIASSNYCETDYIRNYEYFKK